MKKKWKRKKAGVIESSVPLGVKEIIRSFNLWCGRVEWLKMPLKRKQIYGKWKEKSRKRNGDNPWMDQ